MRPCARGLTVDPQGKGAGECKASERLRRTIVHQICCAMEAVALAGVVHRDLAAHNVLVFSEAPICVKITDFGMAFSRCVCVRVCVCVCRF